MSLPVHVVVVGLIIGLTYGLLALGLVLIYKSSRVLNFAHGELGAVSVIVFRKLVNDLGAPYWPTLLGVLVVAMLIGGAVELLLRRLFDAPRLLVMVATIGLAQLLFVLSLLPFIQPETSARGYPVPFHLSATVGTFVLQPAHFAILFFAPAVAVAVALFFRLTPFGLAIRAAAENGDSARLGGIWVRRMSTVSWMLAGMLSAVTAVMVAPFKANVVSYALGPGLMVRALAAALLGGMVNLRVAFAAGVAVGVLEQAILWNWPLGGTVEAVMFGVLIAALLARGRTLRGGTRTRERSSWQLGTATRFVPSTPERKRVGQVSTVGALVVALLLPIVLSNSRAYLFSRISVFAIVALSLTLLTGWAGQLSLGHFGLVAVGAIVTARFPGLTPPLLLLLAGATAAAVAVLVGLPALRIRGLYLAVTSLGFAVLMNGWVLGHRQLGFPDPAAQLVPRPSMLGVDFGPQRTFYYFPLALLVLSVVALVNLRRSGIGRAMLAVRDNEEAAAAMGIRVVRTKLVAFGLSGFLAGVAGVAFAFVQERFASGSGSLPSLTGGDFDPYQSIVIVSMAVIGGMGSIRGAVLGAVYLLGIPAAFGYSPIVEFLTGGIGLTLFILYLPGGLAAAADRAGDAIARLAARRRPASLEAPVSELAAAPEAVA